MGFRHVGDLIGDMPVRDKMVGPKVGREYLQITMPV